MKYRKSPIEIIADILIMLLLIVVMIICIYPVIHVAMSSLSDPVRLASKSGFMIKPEGFSLEAYKIVLSNPKIIHGYMNTLFCVVVGTALSILLTTFGAFFLSRKNVMWKNAIMTFIMITMFFNGGLIPLYFTVSGLGLRDSLWSVIVPFAVSTFNLIIMKTYFSSIPDSLEESAKIDGANDFKILFSIILPLSLPIIAVMILYYGVDRWNGWFYAMTFISDRSKYPLQLILRDILIENSTEMMQGMGDIERANVAETVKYAIIMVATLPIMFIYPFLQKYFVKGIMLGGVKY